MASYRLYFLQIATQIAATDFDGENDEEAIALALRMTEEPILELWSGSRLVARSTDLQPQ